MALCIKEAMLTSMPGTMRSKSGTLVAPDASMSSREIKVMAEGLIPISCSCRAGE
jgi:hypothetical protein